MTKRTVVWVAGLTIVLALIGCGGGGDGGGGTGKLGITANAEENTVTIFGSGNLEALSTFAVSGTWPWHVVLSADGSIAYVLCRDSNSISIVSMGGKNETGTIALSGTSPMKAVLSGEYLYVTYKGSGILSKVLVSGASPAEVATIGLGISNGGGIALTPDGLYAYVGGFGSGGLVKVDIPAMATTEYFDPGYSYIYDMAIDADGIAYFGAYDEYEIPTWDTIADVAGSPIPLGNPELANDLVVDGGKLYISNAMSYNSDYDNGALTIADTGLRWSEYNYSMDDDSSYDVALPFTFGFMGDVYGTITFNSNGVLGLDGYYNYDTGIENILGFSPNNEDLDTGDYYFNYSHRAFADHVVFQWSTATNDNSTASTTVSVFEAVVYDDDRVRFDYLFSMPGAMAEDDGITYGVGDKSGTAVVDLRASEGSPFELRRKSFLWDPAVSTTAMTEVPFTWEGSGALHLPLVNMPHGIALTDKYIFVACPKDGYSSANTTNVVEVYNRQTLLPVRTITVGDGPRGIAIQP